MRLGKRFILPLLFLIGVLMAIGFAGCDTANITNAPSFLAEVAELPAPQLPDWIEEVSPIGNAQTQAQIRIRFKEPLIPLEGLESDAQRQLLQQFELVPPLQGQFRFLTPRMVGFQADAATPLATRVKVTLKAGLADLKNHKLEQDLAWTFQTDRLKLSNLPTSFAPENPQEITEPIDTKPVLKVFSNAELDQTSLQEHAKLIADGKTESVTLKAALEKQPEEETPDPEAAFDPATRNWVYTLEPQQDLAKATQYKLEFTPGLRPAKGNLPTAESFSSRVATYSPLSYQTFSYFGQPDASGTYGRFTKGTGQVLFNNPINPESAQTNISISPEPKQKNVPLVRVYEGDRAVSLNPWALVPTTKYTITIAADLQDKFGQTLGKAVTVDYETGDVAPDLWAPTDLNIFPASNGAASLQLNVSTVNLPQFKSAFAVVQPTDLVYTNTAYPQGNGNDLLPNPNRWQSTKVQPTKNEAVETAIPLQSLLGGSTGMLAYGVQGRTVSYQEEGKQKWREPSYYGLVQLTNLGVFAQWFPESGLVRVHQLSNGTPVANANIQVYSSQLDAKTRSNPTPCATGKTDPAGMLTLSGAAFQRCRKPDSETAPPLLVIAQLGKDWAYTRTLEFSGAYDYGIDAGWENGKPISRGTIFSDRNLYQPNETAYLTGAAYYLQAGQLKQDKNANYKITLQRPDGQKQDFGIQKTTPYGTFSLPVTLPANTPLGTYTVQAKGDSGAEMTGEFRVAEFKPPNFKVELALNVPGNQPAEAKPDEQPTSPTAASAPVPIAIPNQTIEAKVQSNYLFGAPVQSGEAKYYVTRRQTEFTPTQWNDYLFGKRWFWPEEAPEVTSDVLQTTQTLSQAGQGAQRFTIDKDLPYPMEYRVDAQVSDVSNLSVADAQTFIALPSDRLIGLKTNYVADAGQEFPVQVIVSDPQGNPIANQTVKLELQKMNYSAITRVVEGSRTPQNQVEYQTVATQTVNSGERAESANLVAPKSGSYRIRATLDNNEATATDAQIWIAGNEPTFWGDRYRNNRLEVKLDKKSYQPGEVATAIIQSPYPEAELYFAVVRHNPIYQTVQKVKGSAPQIQFTVMPDMAPNAAVEAVLVRQGKPLEQTEPGSLDGLVRIGFVPFATTTADRYLKVEVTPPPGTTIAPSTNQPLELTLRNNIDQPVKGQFTVMVVNEAVLQLTGYRPPDLVKTVFAEQPISVRLSDNRPDVVLTQIGSPLQKGWGYGGGLSAGAANTRTRTNFQPVAYYNGAVVTDGKGKAKVTVPLPDDLTTWRIMVVATDGNLNFGNGEATFMTSQPVVSNPILPQFARPGDRFQVGTSITNNTGREGDLSVTGTVSGSLQFDNTSGSQQAKVGVGTNAYQFPVVVNQPGTATIKFASTLNGNEDAFEVPLEVKPFTVAEQVVETGTTNTQVTIPLNLENNVVQNFGGLDISLASSIVPQLSAPAQQVLAEQNLPFLEPAASQLAIAANLQTLTQTYKQTFAGFNSAQAATQALTRLQALQKPDGGFAAYPDAKKSDPFITAYAATAIAKTQQAFANQEPGNRSQEFTPELKSYLSKTLADPGQYDFCKQALCKRQVRLNALIALAELGDRRSEFLADLYAEREQFDPIDQMKLAQYLAQFPDWQQEARSMAAQLQESTYETGRNAKVNFPEGWRWFGSNAATQAQALQLAIAQKARPETLDRLVKGLLNQRRDGTWQTTYDNAQALSALVAYSQLQPTPPNFAATATLADKILATTEFEGYRKTNATVNIPMSELPRGQQDLTLKKSGNGNLHYLAAYRYRLEGKQPGRLNGLRVTRTIRPANQEKALYTTGLYAVDDLKLPVGQVFDIGVEVITDRPVDHVVITDPLPAGLEAVDDSFQTSTPYFKARGDSWQVSYQTLHHDRIVAFGNKLNPGVYTLHYLVRSVTPGTFVYPGAEAHLQYAPEEFGRSASTTLVLE
jgi:hypothetical protein